MSWDRESLFAKASLYFEKAFEQDREEPFFGLWCAMGLELLLRSAVSNVSPTLLAEPHRDHQNLLHALNLGSPKSRKISIGTAQVLSLCQILIKEFTDSEFKTCSAIINQRNEELHTGGNAFGEYPTQYWIAGFFKSCKILCEAQGESLDSLFEDEIKQEVERIIEETEKETISQTKSSIAAHTKVYEEKSDEEKLAKKIEAEKYSNDLVSSGHHRVDCPACGCKAIISGEPYGKENVQTIDGEIIVRQSMLPTRFVCKACDLKLNGYSSLAAADLANYFTRRRIYSPEAYFELIHPDDYDSIEALYLEQNPIYEEYNNE